MLVFGEDKNPSFLDADRRDRIVENGYVCGGCSNEFFNLDEDGNKVVNMAEFHYHHVHPLVNGGYSRRDNGLVICKRVCHHGVHDFIDCFAMEEDADYEYLMTVYVAFFMPHKQKSLSDRYNYKEYDLSRIHFASKFWRYVASTKTETRAIFAIYMDYFCSKGDVILPPEFLKYKIGFCAKNKVNILNKVMSKPVLKRYFGRYRKMISHLHGVF